MLKFQEMICEAKRRQRGGEGEEVVQEWSNEILTEDSSVVSPLKAQ